ALSGIKSCLPSSLDPHQFAYCPNRSTEDAIFLALHTTLSHLGSKNTCARLLFIGCSAAFNTITLQKLVDKLSLLGFNTTLCNWSLDFLTEDHSQYV
ncbi:hypothetical protein LDENG_00276780, partial [Lucifuga dentata]